MGPLFGEVNRSCSCFLHVQNWSTLYWGLVSSLPWFIRYIYHWYLQLLNNVVIIKTKKSLKIPKGQSESVYRRRTEQTTQWPKETKKYKRTNNDLQNIHIKLKIE